MIVAAAPVVVHVGRDHILRDGLNRLDEIGAAVDAIPDGDPRRNFARSAMRVMVHAAGGEDDAARERLAAVRDGYIASMPGMKTTTPGEQYVYTSTGWVSPSSL